MFDLEEYVPYLLHQAHLAVLRAFEAGLTPSGLSLPEWRVLAVLAHHKRIRFGQLAKITGQEPPTLVRLLSAMEERQLLLRKASETDRRATDVELTDQGKTLAESILPLAQATVDKAFTGFTDDEAEFLRRLLRRIQKNMEAPN
ncbi:MAG TPA: MarR family transcriptional regulator [Rhodocyclaceae bacterium]|nr:MarR family transcriptional regulator [Rhodocyclaceae bacterium]